MKCPFCGYEDTKVMDSRPTEDGLAIHRRRDRPLVSNSERQFLRRHADACHVYRLNRHRTARGVSSVRRGCRDVRRSH